MKCRPLHSLGKMAMDSGRRSEGRQEHTQSQCHGLLALYMLARSTNKKVDIRLCSVGFLCQLYSLRLSAATIYKSRNYPSPRTTDAALRIHNLHGEVSAPYMMEHVFVLLAARTPVLQECAIGSQV